MNKGFCLHNQVVFEIRLFLTYRKYIHGKTFHDSCSIALLPYFAELYTRFSGCPFLTFVTSTTSSSYRADKAKIHLR